MLKMSSTCFNVYLDMLGYGLSHFKNLRKVVNGFASIYDEASLYLVLSKLGILTVFINKNLRNIIFHYNSKTQHFRTYVYMNFFSYLCMFREFNLKVYTSIAETSCISTLYLYYT